MSLCERAVIVLVGTSDPGNIGASARAMKTMGMDSLRLVAPRNFPHPKALWRAAHATDVVEQAQVYNELAEAVADCELVFATSARSRSLPWPLSNVRDAASEMASCPDNGNRVAVVFGREKSGLTNGELQLCHRHIMIPANADYPVLNLSHAVQLVCYELFNCQREQPAEHQKQRWGVEWDQPLATHEEVQAMLTELEKVLIATGFYNPEQPDKLIPRLQRMFMRAGLDQMETNIWRGIISHVFSLRDKQCSKQ